MNTRQYTAEGTRAKIKKQQRTPAYRELQKRTAEERTKLEVTTKQRGDELKKTQAELKALQELWASEAAVKNRHDVLVKQREINENKENAA